MKKRAKKIARIYGFQEDKWEYNCDNLQACSCWGCGHVRKWHGPTKQEKYILLKLKEEIDDLQ